jgi:cholesterol transport system auxiliary component
MIAMPFPTKRPAHGILRALASAALALALAGCSVLPDNREELSIWAVDAVPAAAAGPAVDWQLAMDEPTAAEPLDGTRIVLSPAPGEFGVYRGARWTERVPRMLQTLVLRSLEDSGRIKGVGRGNTGVRADYRLLLDLRAFHVDGGARGAARVAFSARLLRWPEGAVVAARTFEATAPVEGSGIAAVVAAFRAASEEAVPAVADWVLAEGEDDHARQAGDAAAP